MKSWVRAPTPPQRTVSRKVKVDADGLVSPTWSRDWENSDFQKGSWQQQSEKLEEAKFLQEAEVPTMWPVSSLVQRLFSWFISQSSHNFPCLVGMLLFYYVRYIMDLCCISPFNFCKCMWCGCPASCLPLPPWLVHFCSGSHVHAELAALACSCPLSPVSTPRMDTQCFQS